MSSANTLCSSSRVTETVRVGVVIRAAITSSRSRCSKKDLSLASPSRSAETIAGG